MTIDRCGFFTKHIAGLSAKRAERENAMTIEQAQEIIKNEGLAWKVVDIYDISDFTILIICKWTKDGVEEDRYVSYSKIYNGVFKIQ